MHSNPYKYPLKPFQLPHLHNFQLLNSLLTHFFSLLHTKSHKQTHYFFSPKSTKMAYPRSSLVLALLSMFISFVLASSVTYDVVSLGAIADGKTDSTQAFVSAWTNACASVSSAMIYVPAGRFYLGQVVFSGPCKNNAITVRIAGTLVAPSDYTVLGNTGTWLLFEQVNGVTISGGILDGQGTGLWSCKASGNGCPSGATVCEND